MTRKNSRGGGEGGAGKRERILLLLPSLSRAEGNGRNRKGGGETGPRRGVALICLDTNLFPRQTQPLGLDDGPPSLLPPSRGIVIPLCYVIDAVPVVTNFDL